MAPLLHTALRRDSLLADGANLRFLPTTDSYSEQLAYFAKLYKEGLIEQEVFTSTSTKVLSYLQEHQLGVVCWWSVSFLSTDIQDDFVHLDRQLIGPDGKSDFTCVISSVNSPAAFVVTTKCENPEIATRWINYFYSEDGIILYFLGVEGVTYEYDSDGNPYFLDDIVNNPDGLTFMEAYGHYCCQAGGANSSIISEKYYISGEGMPKSRAASDALKADTIDFSNVWEPFIYSSAESEVMSSLSTDITSYIKESRAKFVSGEWSTESDWDAYVKERLEDYMKMYQIGYNRYMGITD